MFFLKRIYKHEMKVSTKVSLFISCKMGTASAVSILQEMKSENLVLTFIL